MKIKRVMSKRAYSRFKFMCASGLGLLALTYVNDKYVTGAVDGYWLSPSDDMGGIFVNAAEGDEEVADDGMTKVIRDYPTAAAMEAKDQKIGDVNTVAPAETPYNYNGVDYKNKAVQTRSLGYVVEFYQEQ